MFHYYVWALGEKALGLAPGGKALYRTVGRLVKGRARATEGNSLLLSRS